MSQMILRSSPASPFGRKTKIAAHILGLMDRITVEATNTGDPSDTIRQQNPLGKIPCLIVDGDAFYDSRVIVEVLDGMAGGGGVIPRSGAERYRALTLAAMADGIMEAALLIVYEARMRPADKQHEDWVTYQREKITRALDVLAASPPALDTIHVGHIGVACALGYMDLRRQVDWRSGWPVMVTWLNDFAAKVPSFAETAPPPS